MKAPKDVLTSGQLGVMLVSMVLGVDNFIMPRLVAGAAGRDGWLSLLLAAVWIVGTAAALVHLAGVFPGQPPHQWLSRIVGKIGARALIIFYIVYFFALSAWVLRSFADMARVYLLPNTPSEAIMLTFLFSMVYVVINGINPLARVTQIFFVFTIVPSFLLIIMSRVTIDFSELLPVLAHGWLPVAKGMPSAIAAFIGWGVVVYLIQFMDQPKKAVGATTIGLGFLGLLFIWTFAITLATYGPVELRYLLYPVVDVIREMESSGTFIEKMDVILLAVWIMSVFVTLSLAYYVAVLACSQLTGLQEQHTLVYLGLPLLYLLALLPTGNIMVETLGRWLGLLSVMVTLAIPPLVGWAYLKHKRGGLTDGRHP